MLSKRRKVVLISTFITIGIFLLIIPFKFNASLVDILEEALGSAIASLIRGIAVAIATLINKMDAGMDKLIFNIASNFKEPTLIKDANITLLKNNTLSSQLMTLYDLFIYIAVTMLGSIGAWITIDFIKTSNDARHKVVLKDRLKKLIISIVLLTSMPLLFDELMIINQVIVDVFRLVIVNAGGGDSVKGLFLSDIFKTMSENNKSDIILAIIYLMSTFINLWLVVFYMLRDLAISLLFIISPVIAIMLPYRTDLVLKWFKEMISNIFTQSIQAFIMAVVIMIASAIGTDAKLYDQIFALVAFASFIPLTAAVKKALGLEGEIGAAKSNAGLGGVVGAVGVAGAAYAGIKVASNRFKDANEDIKNISAEETLLKKSKFESNNVGGITRINSNMNGNNKEGGLGAINGKDNPQGPSPSGTTGGGRGIGIDPNNRANTNKRFGVDTQANYDELKNGNYTATSRARELQGMKSNAKRLRNKAVLSGLGSSIGGAVMGLGSMAYGNPFISMMASRIGMNIGDDIGDFVSDKLTDVAQETREFAQDRRYGEGIRYDGEQNQALGSLFDGVDIKSSPKEIFSTIKNNYNKNNDIIQHNKTKGREQANIRATGLDKYSMNSKDYNVESSAILKRNKLERQGKFSKAHRRYAKDTYNRNNEYIPEFIAPTGKPRLAEVKNKLLENKGKDEQLYSPGLYPAGIPEPKEEKEINNKPISNEVNKNINPTKDEIEDYFKEIEDSFYRVDMAEETESNIPSGTNEVKVKNTNNDRRETNDYLNELNSTLNELSEDVMMYENNSDYLSALDDIYCNVEDIHIGNDYSQLV